MMTKLKKILIAFSLPLLLVVGFILWRILGGKEAPQAALSLNLSGPSQEVWIEGEKKGTTPFYSDALSAGEAEVRVASWSARLTLTPNALTAAKLDFGPSAFFSGEQIFWLEKSEEARISVTSNPEGAEITINEESQGASPLSLPLSPGAYTLSISKPGYEGEILKVQVQAGYKLNAWFKLKLRPVPEGPTEIALSDWGFSEGENVAILYDFSTADAGLSSDISTWTLGISHYFLTHPEEEAVDYFLEPSGKVLDSSGSEVSGEWVSKEKITLAYLGTAGVEVPQEAKDGLIKFLKLTFPSVAGPKVKILPTGVGFLRVRSGPGTSYEEIAKITPGEEYPVLEEKSGWYKISLADGSEGWITGRWAQKIESE